MYIIILYIRLVTIETFALYCCRAKDPSAIQGMFLFLSNIAFSCLYMQLLSSTSKRKNVVNDRTEPHICGAFESINWKCGGRFGFCSLTLFQLLVSVICYRV